MHLVGHVAHRVALQQFLLHVRVTRGGEQVCSDHLCADLSEGTAGLKEFYLKVQLHGAGDWCTLWNLEVKTETTQQQ